MNLAPDACVLVIGAAGVDVIGRLEEEALQAGTSNRAQIRAGFGGVARNVAENLARLGQSAALISVVGQDRSGDEILAHAAAAGIDVAAVRRSSELPTGHYTGILDPTGRLLVGIDDMRALEELTPAALEEQADLFRQSALLFMDANIPPATLEAAIEIAGRTGLPICADTASRALAGRLAGYVNQFMMITANAAEASELLGERVDPLDEESVRRAARALVNGGAQIALITLAERGVYYADPETNGHIPAIRTQIVDPTGAGDALTAAVLFGMLNDIPLDDSVRLGVSAASLTLRHPGAVCPDLTLQKLYDQLLV